MPIGSRYFLVKCSKLGKYSQNESFCFGSGVFCLWCRHTWEILSLSDYFVRFVLFPTRLSLSCPKLFFSISGDFLGIFKGPWGSSGISLFSNNQRTQLGERAKLGRKMAKWNHNKIVLLHISGFPIFGSSLPASCPL